MSKAEGKEILRDAKNAGREYAEAQIESDHFAEYVSDQVYSARVEDLPDTKKEALRTARSILTDLANDIGRDLSLNEVMKKAGVGHTFTAYGEGYTQKIYGIDARDVYEAFHEGVGVALGRKSVESWVVDEILFRARERRGEE